MQVMIYLLMKRKTKLDSPTFFKMFIQTYKNKIVTSLCFFNCFSEMFYNENLEQFRDLGFQLLYEKSSILVYQKNNIIFLEECFINVYSVCNYFLEKKEFSKLKEIYHKINYNFDYFPRKSIIDKMNSNKNILKILINICCLCDNENVFENKIKFDKFQKDKYNKYLSAVESYSLFNILNLIHILNFDDKEVVIFIFELLFEKLYNFKNYKETLSYKIFSPYLIVIKCYSILLNRFCFNYSIKNNCDLLDSFSHFLDLFPKAKDLNIFIFKELIIFFSFIISQYYSFFNYYGNKMKLYYKDYFNMNKIGIQCDISLMQYLLCQPEIKEQFNLQNILLLSDIDSSNNMFQKLINENSKINDFSFIDKVEENNLNYINSVIEYLYLIIRNNLSMEKIAFVNNNLAIKTRDEIYEKLYLNEKDNINKLVKNDIIHFILGQENLVERDDCIDYLNNNFHNNYLVLLDGLLKNDCEKKVLTNSLIKYSLKKEILYFCDIDNIISFEYRINAIKYMTNFQSNNCDVCNINILSPLNIKKEMIKKIYQTFYNEKNIEEIIKLYNLIYTNKENGKILNEIFYSNITKILSFIFKLCSTDLLDKDFKIKILEKMKHIKDNQFKEEKSREEEVYKKPLKDKLKKIFVKRNEKINEKIIPSDIIIKKEDSQKDQESCVYCLQKINKGKNNNIFFHISICSFLLLVRE